MWQHLPEVSYVHIQPKNSPACHPLSPPPFDCQRFMWSVCPCWQPLFFCLGGEQKILHWQCKIFHLGERESAPVALIYSIRNGETSEIECGGEKSQTITCRTPRTASHTETDQPKQNKTIKKAWTSKIMLQPLYIYIYIYIISKKTSELVQGEAHHLDPQGW